MSQPARQGFAAGPPQGETRPLGAEPRGSESADADSDGAKGRSLGLGHVQRSTRSDERGGNIALFDLDHTLLVGDSDVLWCDFLIAKGILDRDSFAARNVDIEARYQAGLVDPVEFAAFYVSTLAGRTPAQWEPLRQEFLHTQIVPRIPLASMDLVRRHQDSGDLVVLTTATNRYITELTAIHLGIDHLIATETEVVAGVFSGRPSGVLNMRGGKVTRLHDWLRARAASLDQFHSTGYSDSINDLPLLEAVDLPVVVNADPRLAAVAQERGWRTLSLVL